MDSNIFYYLYIPRRKIKKHEKISDLNENSKRRNKFARSPLKLRFSARLATRRCLMSRFLPFSAVAEMVYFENGSCLAIVGCRGVYDVQEISSPLRSEDAYEEGMTRRVGALRISQWDVRDARPFGALLCLRVSFLSSHFTGEISPRITGAHAHSLYLFEACASRQRRHRLLLLQTATTICRFACATSTLRHPQSANCKCKVKLQPSKEIKRLGRERQKQSQLYMIKCLKFYVVRGANLLL